ncbi:MULTISPECIES: hypothetical protein [unclassified Arthrobacter]|uniref:hypothetical protein n=1 Tax=unclassified Arthrobacter TaxID=235627 RepID=UPI001D6288CD|nr:hypothetical protein [Arthrobacter sp. Bi26]CAH0157645.1 hypothetical protein SRABI26_00871 [Arthrobacter sp. Bi26]
MKVSLLTAVALIGLFGLTGCTGQSQGTNSAPESPAATTASAPPPGTAAESTDSAVVPDAALPPGQLPPTAIPNQLAEGKVHFTGDYTKATPADSAKIIELAKQWHSADKEALFHEKMDGSGLSSNVPPEQAETFYGRAAEACQRRFDGYKPPLEGSSLEIENLALSIYCPALGNTSSIAG